METVENILAELRSLASEQNRNTLLNHGGPAENLLGVKIGDMKPIQKRIKKNYALSLGLWDSGISDARYLAALIADEKQMTTKDLQHWCETADWGMLSEYSVAWIAAESRFGWELGLEWIRDPREKVSSAGWNTLASYIMITPNDKLDLKALSQLLHTCKKNIHQEHNRTRYCMNNFLIAVGGSVPELTDEALLTASEIGTVAVHMGNTACKVPPAADYIRKMESGGHIGKKKKMARC
jgi:3-methyladenine DNA glycosylase AlkD